MEVGLVEAGDDLFDEVASGAETAPLSQEQGRFRVVEWWPNV